MKHRIFFLITLLFCWGGLRAEPLKVAVLHPVLVEWVEKLGGDAVVVTSLLPAKVNLHDFSPTPKDMVTLREQDVIVAMGKHLEPYLDRLRENLPASVEIIEAGRRVPSVKVDPRLEAFACCPLHTHGAIDPHWWHSPMSTRRAVRSLGRELAKKLPDHRDEILDRTRDMTDALEQLHQWAEGELSVVPSNRRKLVTAHAAFGYFCKEYDFKAIPVAGLSNEGQPTPDFLAETIQILNENQVPAVFPEISAGAAALEALKESTGVDIAPPLFADFLPTEDADTYEAMFKANVNNLVKHLGVPATP